MLGLLGVVAAGVLCVADNEITASYMLSVQKGYLNQSENVQGLQVTMAGSGMESKTTVFTNGAGGTLSVSDSVGTPGMALIRNISTNDTAIVTAVFKLAPGQCVMGPLDTNAISVAAVTNSVTIKSLVISK